MTTQYTPGISTPSDRLFVSLMLIGIAVVALIWSLEEYFDVILPYDRYGYFITIVVGAFCLVLAHFLRRANTAKILLFFYMTLYLISLTILSFISSAKSGDVYSFASTLQWIPILYLVAFLFLSVKQAVFSTIGIYALLVCLLILPYLGFLQLESPALKALSINITLSHAVYIFCMFGVIKLKQTQKESQLKALQMEHAANNDGLLGIGNRRLLEAELDSRVAKQTPFSLLLIDIDLFKSINDIHGHLVGDDTLREITRCMNQNLRPQDTLGRWGGEEFLVIANGANFDSAMTLAERLRTAVETYTFTTVGKVTVSIGVAQFKPDTPLSQTFSEADKALYRAKNTGRNQVVAAA